MKKSSRILLVLFAHLICIKLICQPGLLEKRNAIQSYVGITTNIEHNFYGLTFNRMLKKERSFHLSAEIGFGYIESLDHFSNIDYLPYPIGFLNFGFGKAKRNFELSIGVLNFFDELIVPIGNIGCRWNYKKSTLKLGGMLGWRRNESAQPVLTAGSTEATPVNLLLLINYGIRI